MKFDRLTGVDRAAILLMSLGEEAAARIFRELAEDEIEQISRSMTRIDHIPLSIKNEVLQQFSDDQQKTAGGIFVKGAEFARKSIRATGQAELTEFLLKKQVSDSESRSFDFIAAMKPRLVAEYLEKEHPQAAALILSTQEPEHGSAVISFLPDEMQADIIKRMAGLEHVPAEIIDGLEEFLRQEIGSSAVEQHREIDGFEKAVQILRTMNQDRNSAILEQIDDMDAELAQTMRSKMFTFEGLATLDDHVLQSLLREVSNDSLTLALKNSSEKLKARIFSNLSPRAVQMIREDLETIGSARMKEVEAVQRSIVKKAMKVRDEIASHNARGSSRIAR